MTAILPLSVESLDVCQDETFVLTTPDFDSQNIMIDARGNLTGIIDWDHVQTMPRCLGYCRCPEWITRDCDPVRCEYPSSTMKIRRRNCDITGNSTRQRWSVYYVGKVTHDLPRSLISWERSGLQPHGRIARCP